MDYELATVNLVSRESNLPVSSSSLFFFKSVPRIKSITSKVGRIEGGTLVGVDGQGRGVWLNSTLLACYFGDIRSRARLISPTSVRVSLAHFKLDVHCNAISHLIYHRFSIRSVT